MMFRIVKPNSIFLKTLHQTKSFHLQLIPQTNTKTHKNLKQLKKLDFIVINYRISI